MSYKIKRPESDFNLENEVVQKMWFEVDIYSGMLELERGLRLATIGQRAVFATRWLLAEVDNGGFAQFFHNSTGIVTYEALNGFQLLGAESYAHIVSEAILLFPDSTVPGDRQERWDVLDRVDHEKLRFLDDGVYALEESDPIEQYVRRYIFANPAEFFE